MDKYKNALSKAAKLCSSREKCSFDIYNKLLSFGLNEAEASKAIAYLKENQFIDDQRFAIMFVKDKFRINGWGKIKITYALRQKNIPEEIIKESMNHISETENNELIDRLIKNKIKSSEDLSSPAVKAKIFRFAAQRGFTSDEIYRSIDRINKR